jgi:hypothetical protein
MPESTGVATFIDRVSELCNELYRSEEIIVTHMEVESIPESNAGDHWQHPYPHVFYVTMTVRKP